MIVARLAAQVFTEVARRKGFYCLSGSRREGGDLRSRDRACVECRQEQPEDVRLLMIETMQKAPERFVTPMVVEAKIAANWGDAK